MIKIISVLILSIFIITSCKNGDQQEFSLEDVQINETNDYLQLPAGIIENKVKLYEEGFTQHFIYPDSSYVIILKGENAELALPKTDNPDIFSKKENIEKFQIIYGNVKSSRKDEFDFAFKRMKKNGIKKK
ncbi:hypothetical protein [Salegentibacter chungangensis]|uniref:DUF4369 domain-containing protein n=1 Tax=Salegentibacter chungangensis TaxID=1335724 RepID=A0ABW3NTH2_9FLAO